ncbi:MAG: hypothetical protein PHD61_08405 [Bacteroidales bacterium]|nr:hypothetical protein [Lentimicrobiaceae bacterium]MDD5695312.1 hypothetical protein [Bacteroidales bacterium]
MRKKELVQEVIAETLESINEENEIIRSRTSTIPQIELDLILENIRKLYANFRLLDKYNQEETESPSAFRASDQPITIGFERKKKLPEEEQVKEAIPETEPETESDLASDSHLVPESEPVEESGPVEETIPPVPHPEMEVPVMMEKELSPEPEVSPKEKVTGFTFDLFSSPPATIADQYRREEKTIHEQISSQESRENIASKIQHTPITELKAVIGLNDKFIFINELFHGNMKAYQETIHSLDQLTTLNDAIRYFTEVKDSFDMNEELDSFRRLAEMIQRKFRGEGR